MILDDSRCVIISLRGANVGCVLVGVLLATFSEVALVVGH